MSAPADDRAPRALVLDTLPDAVVASMEVRDAWRGRASESGEGLEFLVTDLARWPPGSTRSGRLPRRRQRAARRSRRRDAQITDACNIQLDFGRDAAGGTYRPGTRAQRVLGRDPRQLRPGRLLLPRRNGQHRRDHRPPGDPVGDGRVSGA